MNIINNKAFGGAEFLPSLEVPYDIPKAREIAFITCSYPSDSNFDYRSAPLARLEEDLKSFSYKKVVVIASKDVLFPNGTLAWFLDRGYIDKGIVYYEELDQAEQHLLIKEL